MIEAETWTPQGDQKRMFKRNRVLGGVLLACALLASQTARADDEKAVHLLVTPKVGRVLRTTSIVKISMMGMDVEVHAVEKATIKEVLESGAVITEVVDEGGKINTSGQEQNLPVTPAYSTTHDKFGKTTKGKPRDNADDFTTPEITRLMDSITDIVLTDKALKPSDTWQNELENPAVPEKKVLVKDTYFGLEKIDGRDCWKIKQTAEAIMNAAGGKVTYEVTEWIDPTDGRSVKLEGSISSVPTKFGTMSMHISAKSVLVADNEKPEAAKPEKKDN